jgi:pilus assembly protein Flp/PilA
MLGRMAHNRIYNKNIIDYLFGKEVKDMLYAPRERGQGLVEYAFLLVLIALVAIGTFLVLGPAIGNVFTKLNSMLTTI